MNTGLNLELEKQHQDGTEWQFGAVSQPGLATISEIEREDYLPTGELQKGVEDFQDCVTRGFLNSLETQFNWLYRNDKLKPENKKWLETKGYVKDNQVSFSDRYIAVLSGTTRTGNSLKAPVDAIRKQGVIPKSLLPKELNMTWDTYHDPSKITDELKQLGQDFLKRFSINYEQVPTVLMSESVKDDLVVVAGYAWPTPEGGVYPNHPELPFNHCWMNFKNKYYAFDNYPEFGTEDDWIKQLAPDYTFYDYGYRVFVSAEKDVTLADLPDTQKIPLFDWLAKMIAWLFTKSGPMPEIPKEILPEKPVVPPIEPPKPKVDYIERWAKAIEDFESGGDTNAPNYRRNNPGNCKNSQGQFIVFATYAAGFSYLCNYLIRAATNDHQAYVQKAAQLKLKSSGDLTIKQFIEVYTFGDSALIQTNYANHIAKRLDATPETAIKTFL
jgi:hypothetical protein